MINFGDFHVLDNKNDALLYKILIMVKNVISDSGIVRPAFSIDCYRYGMIFSNSDTFIECLSEIFDLKLVYDKFKGPEEYHLKVFDKEENFLFGIRGGFFNMFDLEDELRSNKIIDEKTWYEIRILSRVWHSC